MHIVYNKLKDILIFEFFGYGDGDEYGNDEYEGDGFFGDNVYERDEFGGYEYFGDGYGDGNAYNYGTICQGGDGYSYGYDDGGGNFCGDGEIEDDILIFEEK